VSGVARRRRAVVLVGNPAAPYSRGLRIARALDRAGYAVEIAAVATPELPDREGEGPITLRRYRPSGPWASMAATFQPAAPRRRGGTLGAPLRVARRLAGALRRWAFWPHTVRGWWATLEHDLEPADLYHACGSLAMAPALAARARDHAAGRQSRVVYDAIDDVVAGNNFLGFPRPVRSLLSRRERRWARAADARTTVNDALADRLQRRWGTGRPTVIPNWPERVLGPDDPVPDLLRGRLGLSPATRIVLFQGRLGPHLGIDEAAHAVLDVDDAVLCLIGFGRGYEASRVRDREPAFAGRHFTLPAVHPDELLEWTASADAVVVPLPPVSANQRASSPNKFWEAIAAGTPVVIGPGLDVMAEQVQTHDLGVVAASLRPADLAAAIGRVLDVDPEVALARRRRIARVAAERFSWPVAEERYLELVRELGQPAAGRSPRAVVLVGNPANPYSRGLRVARSLVDRGFDVEIAAMAGEGLPDEEYEGPIRIRRYAARGRWVDWHAGPSGPSGIARKVLFRAHKVAARLVPSLATQPAPTLDVIRRRLFWPTAPRGWWAALMDELPPADLYHCCGIQAIGIAGWLSRDAKAKGRAGRVVYDVIDAILDSNNYARTSRPVLAFYRRRERGWARAADAIVTVNRPIAEHLRSIWRLDAPPTVLLNCQPRWTPPAVRPDRIRAATGLPAERAIVLFLGKIGRERGLDEAAQAVLRLDDAALVVLGFGPWAETLRGRDADPRFAGRHVTLPPVHPDAVPEWTASADVSIVAVPANSLNQRLSTPNKFWESMTAGTPIVVGRDLEVMRGIVEAEDIGATADPTDPDDLARALRSLIDAPVEEREARRARALAAARDRYNWETAVEPYLALVERLVPAVAGRR
jgi:glycosyltransferase involved in cell wall biosynthesis